MIQPSAAQYTIQAPRRHAIPFLSDGIGDDKLWAWISAIQFGIPENLYQDIKVTNHLHISTLTEQLSTRVDILSDTNRHLLKDLSDSGEFHELVSLIWYLNFVVLGAFGLPPTDPESLAENLEVLRALAALFADAREKPDLRKFLQNLLEELRISQDERMIYQYVRIRNERTKPLLVITEKQVIRTAVAVNLLALCYKDRNLQKWYEIFDKDIIFLNIFTRAQSRKHSEHRQWYIQRDLKQNGLIPWSSETRLNVKHDKPLTKVFRTPIKKPVDKYILKLNTVDDWRIGKNHLKLTKSLDTIILNADEEAMVAVLHLFSYVKLEDVQKHDRREMDKAFKTVFNQKSFTFLKPLKSLCDVLWLLNSRVLNGFGKTSIYDKAFLEEQTAILSHLTVFLKLNEKGEIIKSKTNTAMENQLQAIVFGCFEENLQEHDFNKHFHLITPDIKEMAVKRLILVWASVKVMNHYYRTTNWIKWRYLFGNEQKFVLNVKLSMSHFRRQGVTNSINPSEVLCDLESFTIIPWREQWSLTREQIAELTNWF